MYTDKQRKSYNIRREQICDNLNITKNQYNTFRRLGNALHSEYENQCNGFDNTADERDSEVREEELNNKGRELAKKLGLFIFYQTDPRGATIYLDKKPIAYDSYTNAFCIY